MKNLEILDDIIVGRVEPYIYAFSTGTVPNYLKVGDTYRPVPVRLKEWKQYFPDLKEEFKDKATVNADIFFRDYAVHQYLENELKKQRLTVNDIGKNGYFSNEFFKDAKPLDIVNAILDIKENYECENSKYKYYHSENKLPEVQKYKPTGTWDLRPNQKKAVDNFKKAVGSGRRNLLMYAVMRFGKSFTSLCCAKEINAKKILIVSAKADVADEWKKTVESADNFNNIYVFVSSKELELEDDIIKNTIQKGKGVVIFLTLQDLQGETLKDKHQEVFEEGMDLLIIDETHYGARAEKYGQIIKNSNYEKDIKEKFLEEETEDVEEVLKTVKSLKVNVKLHLSGTPYRILMGSEFEKEDIVTFCQFSDIVEEQEEWNKKNTLLEDKPEWENPYFGFPKMIRFAFNPSSKAKEKLEFLRKSGSTYAFSALFKPKSIKKTKDKLHKKFIFENEILELFEVIDGSKEDEGLLGFLNYERIKDGNMCRHIVCVLPYCSSCDALEELLLANSDKFKNLNQYSIINISGIDKPNEYKNIKAIKDKIKKCEDNNKKTITLTVNRMLTGSTVEQWDTMMFFKDTASPQEYDQAIFRLQNQYVKSFNNEVGEEIKYNMKPQTLLVDFDVNRMFYMQEQKALIYNANTDVGGNKRLQERIEKELHISPIITVNRNSLVEVTPTDILNYISEYSNNRGVFDEAKDIPVDLSLFSVEAIKIEIEKQAEFGSKNGFEIPTHEGEETDLNTEVAEHNSENSSKDNSTPKKENDKEESSLVELENKFRTYYSRILFYAFLTKNKLGSLDEIITSLDTLDNTRILNNLNLSKDILLLIRKHMNTFILSQLDYKIQNINNLAQDENLAPIQRALTAINKFGKLSVSEITTPEKICRDMVNLLPNSCFENMKIENHVMLDIASKAGEYAIAICKRVNDLGIETFQIKKSILSIPTSTVAYEFTRKIYEVLGLDVECISREFKSSDLLSIRKIDDEGSVDYQKINNILSQNKPFCEIRLDDVINGNEVEKMKFDAIVGNPPYQENIGSTLNKSLSKQLYPMFMMLAINMNPKYLSLITPSRWFTGNAQDRSFVVLREFLKKHNHFSHIINYLSSSDVFVDVSIPGGVNMFLYKQGYIGEVIFEERINNESSIVNRPLFEEGLDIVLPMNKMIGIIHKVVGLDFKSMSEIVTGRNPFGVPATDSELNDISSSERNKHYDTYILCAYEQVKYIPNLYIKRNRELLGKWKVFTSKMNGGAGTLLDDKEVSILGKTFIAEPNMSCSNTLLAVGGFENEIEAINLNKYMNCKFFRFMLGIKKIAQVLTSNVYSFVPQQNFRNGSDINWNTSISNIDKQLYIKYNLTEKEISYIEEKIKTVE